MSTYRLWPSTSGPAAPVSYGGNFIAGTVFFVTSESWFQGYWWWCCNSGQSTDPVKCALWLTPANGSTPQLVGGSVVWSGTLTAGSWNYIPLPKPIPLSLGGSSGTTPNTNNVGDAQYIAAVGFVGDFPDTNNYWGSGQPGGTGITNGPLNAYSATNGSLPGVGGAGSANGDFGTGNGDPAVSCPEGQSNTDNFWVDVQVADYASAAPSNPSFRIWPNTPNIVTGPNGDDTLAVTATAFTINQPCQLQKIWMNNPPGSTGQATRCAIWDTSTKTVITGTDNSSPTWLQRQSFFGSVPDTTVANGLAQNLSPNSNASQYTLGNQFSLSSASTLSAIWFYSPLGYTILPTACAVYEVSTQTIVSGTQVNSPNWVDYAGNTASAGGGWLKCELPSPVSLSASTNYIVAVQGGDGVNYYYTYATQSTPVTNGVINVAGFMYTTAGSLTYPGTSVSSAIAGVDIDIITEPAAGAGWIYVDYSSSSIILPAGTYMTSFFNGNGLLIYSDFHNYFFAGTDPKGGGTVGGAGWNGISYGNGILTVPNVANGPQLIYDDSSGTFPGQSAYLPTGSGWGYPGYFEASADWGETRWADVEVTPHAAPVNPGAFMTFFT